MQANIAQLAFASLKNGVAVGRSWPPKFAKHLLARLCQDFPGMKLLGTAHPVAGHGAALQDLQSMYEQEDIWLLAESCHDFPASLFVYPTLRCCSEKGSGGWGFAAP